MEIKILCACGAKFKFDVEPVNGRSPGAVLCPVCGKDNTEATNALIQEKLTPAAPTPATVPAAIKVAVPSSVPAPAVSSAGPKISIPAIRIPAAPIAPTAAPTPAASAAPAVASAAPPPPTPQPSPMPVSAPAPPPPVAAAAPAAAVGPKMAVMPVPTTTKSFSVKPPGEAGGHAAPAPAATSVAATPTPGVGPKMAVMAVPTGGGASLSVSGGHGGKKEEPAQAAATTTTPQPTQVQAAHPATAKMSKPAPPPSSSEGSFGLGVTGAIIGALIGTGIWYFIAVNAAGVRILACIPGIVGGLCAALLGRKQTEKLGYASAVVAGVITVATQFAVISGINDHRLSALVEQSYTERMTLAKQAAAAVTDDQVKKFMLEDPTGGASRPEDIDADALAKYRKGNLLTLQKFAKGEPSRTKFQETERAKFAEDDSNLYQAGGIKLILIIMWIISGTSSAFKIASGKKK